MMNAVISSIHVQFSRETLLQIRAEIQPLIEKHHNEIAHYQDIPLNIDWEAYAQAEVAGKLYIFSARKEGELIGYAAFVVNYHPNQMESLQALQNGLFILPEYRRGNVGKSMLTYCDWQLKEEGVQVVYHHSNIAHDIGVLLESLGYEAVDMVYARRLDK